MGNYNTTATTAACCVVHKNEKKVEPFSMMALFLFMFSFLFLIISYCSFFRLSKQYKVWCAGLRVFRPHTHCAQPCMVKSP